MYNMKFAGKIEVAHVNCCNNKVLEAVRSNLVSCLDKCEGLYNNNSNCP